MEQSIEKVDAAPRVVALRARVNASMHELWRMLANPHRHHEVDGSGAVQTRVIGPRELELGDRFRVDMRMMGVPYAITSTVTALEQDRLVEWQHPGGHRWRWELEAQPDGSTIVTESFDYSTARAPRIIERIKAPERNAVSIRDSLAALQRRYGG